ncbi:Nramp family divalent metal transporter [Halodesulfurarchaeum sp. HSR-GB]|uniref:Nramp family divalent metal transporter n=1 Tax=Halodesulfurarchaeum sp. HSR-GB TaxID=3074077 RepID=UPI0028575BD9|nr:Nramp family divalent metal transporter [Halodesulfurarchaeum sp. HSR-GB]MDR5655578.1 Nramp family divalent metal transporter [Halodesulfurarchaeum sp. HSR-GB]
MSSADASGESTAEDMPELTYPEEDWPGFIREHLGPSLLWALLGIGGSHIVLAPTLGGLYGMFGVWVIAIIYLAKYGGWELGIRYNYGIGRNPVEGYGDLPGPDHWGQVFTMLVYLVGWTVILASVGFSAATFLAALVPSLSAIQLYLLLIGFAVALTIVSRYAWIENLMKLFVLVLGGLIVLGVFVSPPSPSLVAETAFSVPDLTAPAFLGIFAALAGYAPTGLSTTVTIGSWSLAKEQGARALRRKDYDPTDERFREYIASWMRTGTRDFRVAFGFSFLLLVSMILLATSVLYPTPPQDQNLAIAIGSILQEGFGDWTFYLVVVGAFAALYSTVITVMDGAARVNADTLPLVLEREMDTDRLRRGFILLMGTASVIPILVIGQLPVTLMVFSAALMAILQVFFYFANYYIVRKHLPEAFQPDRAHTIYYAVTMLLVLGFGIMGGMSRLGLVG